jgi:hypothetical protein
MELKPGASGPFLSRLWIDEEEFDPIASDALKGVKLLPSAPGPVNIEFFVEQHFGFAYEFADLGDECLGFMSFDDRGPRRMVIHEQLDCLDDATTNHRCRSTIAHECGHGLVHTVLYVELWQDHARRKELDRDRLVHHRDRTISDEPPRKTEWWEYQANRLMAALLLPKRLLKLCVAAHPVGRAPYEEWEPADHAVVEAHVSSVFEVSRTMARYRMAKIFETATATR